jgi:hypothetical protein
MNTENRLMDKLLHRGIVLDIIANGNETAAYLNKDINEEEYCAIYYARKEGII